MQDHLGYHWGIGWISTTRGDAIGPLWEEVMGVVEEVNLYRTIISTPKAS